MKQLLSIEWLKLRKLTAFHLITVIYIIILPSWMFAMNLWFGALNKQLHFFPSTKELWSFPTVWRFVTYSGSWFTFLFSIVIIILTTQEFSNKTLRQHVIDGLSKTQVIGSKLLVILLMTIFVTLIVFLTGLFFGMSQNEIDLYTKIHYLFQFMLQAFCYFGFAFVLAMLIKKPALTILVYLGAQFAEFVAGIFLPDYIYSYFPLNSIAKLTPLPLFEQLTQATDKLNKQNSYIPENWQSVIVAVLTMIALYSFAYYRLKKKDL